MLVADEESAPELKLERVQGNLGELLGEDLRIENLVTE